MNRLRVDTDKLIGLHRELTTMSHCFGWPAGSGSCPLLLFSVYFVIVRAVLLWKVFFSFISILMCNVPWEEGVAE